MLPERDTVRAYTVNDFCAAYGIGRSLAYKQIASGALKARKVGKRTLIMHVDAEEWAHCLPNLGSTKTHN